MSAPLADAVLRYAGLGVLPCHTPGHKGGRGAHPLLRRFFTEEGLRADVSLSAELDDLHAPTGCIRAAEELAAQAYGADAAYFMVNGTTGAIHTMLMATLAPGETILVPRNVHRSIVGAMILTGVRPVYLQPDRHAARNRNGRIVAHGGAGRAGAPRGACGTPRLSDVLRCGDRTHGHRGVPPRT